MAKNLAISSPVMRVLGAIMGGAGVVGAISAWNKFPGYPDYSDKMGQIADLQQRQEEEATRELSTAWGGYAAQQRANVEKGLAAQNITDPAVRQRAMQQTETALSGAYAQAKAALEQAKANAGASLATRQADYYQNMAQKQYQAEMGKYMAEQGIWGALGGLGAGLLNIPNSNIQEQKAYGTAPDARIGSETPYPAQQTPAQFFNLPYNEALKYGNR